MIQGVGVDTATISRIARSMQNDHFMQRVFGAEELDTIALRGLKPQSVAAAFAAKEAFGKALGTGLTGFTWTELQLLHAESGAPYFFYCGALAQKMQQARLRAHVSLTHEGDYATAFVVLEQEG